MSLRFVLGRAGSGKSEACLREIRSELKQNPRGRAILYIVPEQMTFQAQRALLSDGVEGSIRADVFSFPRLAWRVLGEVGGGSRIHIDEAGVQMLLRRIVEARKGELRVFQKAAEQTGFLEQLGSMIAEFKRHQVTPLQLYGLWQEGETRGSGSKDQLLASKLHDLQVLYEDFERSLVGKYLDGEDYLKLLCERMPQSQYVRDSAVYVDGFHTFVPQELEVIRQLLRCGADVTVVLTMEEPQQVDELDVFSSSTRAYWQLRQIAEELRIEVQEPILMRGQERFQSAELAHLEQHYDSRPYKPLFGAQEIRLFSAANRRAEVEGAAREIRELVREQGYRYRDIAVMLRNGTSYYDLIKTIFPDYDIPFFIDEKRPMVHHPLVEFIRSALEVVNGNWRYDAIFRCVKTELLYPLQGDRQKLREEMDQFENYCLAYGVQGKRWTSGERWVYRRYRSLEDAHSGQTDSEREMEELLNRLRTMIAEPLLRLQGRLQRAKSVLGMCEAVYLLLEELQVPKKLEALRAQAEAEERFLFANDHEQVWSEVLDLLDKLVELLGEEKLPRDVFLQVMEAGLEALQFANIPPSLDQVIIANIDRSRLSDIRAVILIGANEGVIPAVVTEEGMLSDEERELLLQNGVELAATSRQKLLDEQFVIYQTLTRASDKLYVSCPLADEEGKTLMPSSLFKKLKGLFPGVQEAFLTNDVNDLPPAKQLSYVTTPAVTLSSLTQQLQTWKRYGYDLNLSFWWDVYNFYAEAPEWREAGKRVLGSLFYENRARRLRPEVSRELYGDVIKGSVSRMELFQRCSYAHFMRHGLQLRERDIFKLDAPDIGELFHAALKNIADWLIAQNRSWADLSRSECEHLSLRAMEELAPLLQKEILMSSNRHHYLKRKLQQIIFRASVILSEHAKASGFVPVELEVPFGMNSQGALPPLQMQLENGAKMEVIGRIDRVDKAESEQGTFLRIIDYKSSAKTLDLTEVYYGMALQMLTYLDVVIENAKKWVGSKEASPAGVLYFHIHNPMVSLKKSLSDAEIEQEILKKFKMKGLLLGDADVARMMDVNLKEGVTSSIIPAGLKTDGSFYGQRSSIASAQEFTVLKQHVRRTFETIGTNITEGVIDIAPYKMKEQKACTFCSYRAVCQFDEALPENEYRTLKALKEAEALQRMREGVEQ
ncbi:helicase-exonuclease AddAB subunit AddB [Ectobacillus ponti]|uniref:ATP-dependent helicase/deoxyribonuclease subunit B n=1 Tax=Ectobacillus ponti TaxID=2961894 RepID=A0AA41X7T1_9BACI|nr:helicase-exonuclease AddAB subunit AddB [Ectobacillus ponti]MCP8968239.1 helicase-exonuclease AddAB subunit AddB [Ectobacillus ponti]